MTNEELTEEIIEKLRSVAYQLQAKWTEDTDDLFDKANWSPDWPRCYPARMEWVFRQISTDGKPVEKRAE